MTPSDIEEQLEYLLEESEKELDNYAKLAVLAAKNDAAWKSEYAKRFLQATGPMQHRDAVCRATLAEVYEELQVADALKGASAKRLSLLQTQVDALRTLSASMRAQV